MSLSSLPTVLLIPPVNLLPLGLAGLWLAGRARAASLRRAGRATVWTALLGMVLLSTPLVSGLLLMSLEAGLMQAPPPDTPGAIVILSADYARGGAGGIETGSGIGAMTLDRMRAGALLAHRTGLPILVSGGVIDPGATPIAAQMATALEAEFATPVRWVEPASDDTWENARFSAPLLRRDGIGAAYVVTDGWHMRRALMAFAPTGIVAIPAPVRLVTLTALRFDDVIPSASGFRNSYFALHEWIGVVWYALRLRFG